MPTILNSIKSLNEFIKKTAPSKVCVVTSAGLQSKLDWAIREIDFPGQHLILVPDGEHAKEWNETAMLLETFTKLNIDRNSLVIVLGGGTVGDSVGFAASIYLRGIRYIQVPTTLVAQVDSAHGGKTGVNFAGYKNQVGSFHLPVATVIDMRFLQSLSKEQVIDGLGEVIKAGFIKDTSILDLLQRHSLEDLSSSDDMSKIVQKSIKVKNYFTEKDFKDNTSRQMLNVGHTIGHAIELKYGISHGMAVLVGMMQELAFTESQGFTKNTVRKSLEDILVHFDIKVDLSMKPDWEAIIHDKKVSGMGIDFPIIIKEGKAKVIRLDLDVLKKALFTEGQV